MSFHKLGISELGLYTEHNCNEDDDVVLIIEITSEQVIMNELNELKDNSNICKYSYFNLNNYTYKFVGPAKSFDEARHLYPEHFL